MRRSFARTAMISLAFAFFAAGCSSEAGGLGSFLSRMFKIGGHGVPVVVTKPVFKQLAVTNTVTGVLTPSERIEVKLPGDTRIESFMVNVGDTVAKGAALFQISKEDQNLKIAQLRAEQNELQANLDKSVYFLRNRDRLLEEARITQDQYDNLEGEVDKTEKELERVKGELAVLENQGGESTIASPIAGVVQSKLNAPGGVAAANTPIVTIVSSNPMMVTFRLAAYEAKTVSPGKEVDVMLADFPGERFKAKISSISNELDRDTNTFEVKAALNNFQGVLKAGMNAVVEFSGSEIQAFYEVPAEAIVMDRRRTYVFTVIKGAAHRIPVIPRQIKDGVAQIAEGIGPGDSVVIQGNDKLSEGKIVDIVNR